ncbi:MAG TPA: PAS domain S-box protein [Nitrospira sp.]|nr:PAS domain S-box protein [Nitrospira sp.]
MTDRSADASAATILNVDDNDAARYAKTRMLRGAGYRVLEAGCGEDGLRLVRERTPELVLLDVKLPDLDGLDVCRLIKSDPATSSIMVLLHSTVRLRQEDKVAGLEEGADGYLIEPVEADEVLATVKSLLRLHRSEQRLQLALKATREALWEWDVINDRASWNQAGMDLFGWILDGHSQVAAWWTERIHPDDRRRVSDLFYGQVFTGSSPHWQDEYRFLKQDGTYAHVLDRSIVVRDDQGSPVRIIGAMQDITERKRSEEALRESEARYRNLVSILPAAMYTCDREGRITFYNDRAAELWGRHPKLRDDEEKYCGALRLFLPDGSALSHAANSMADALANGTSYRDHEVVLQKPDGTRSHVLLNIDAITDQKGEIVGGVNVFMDITGRKQVEAALVKRSHQLQVLFELASIVNRGEALELVYEKALDAILGSLAADRASILLFDEGGSIGFVAWRGLSDSYRRAVEHHSPWHKGQADASPIIIEDAAAAHIDPALKDTILQEGIRSLGFIPLAYNGLVIGKFMAYFDRPHRMDRQDQDVALALSNTLATAVERRRAEEALRRSEAELAAELRDTKLLQAISAEMIHEREIEALYGKIVRAGQALMHSDFASMQMLDRERGELVLLAHCGFPSPSVEAWKRVGTDTGCTCGEALRTARRAVAEDVETCAFIVGTRGWKQYRAMGVRAAQSTPLIARNGSLVGMLSTHWRLEHRPSEHALRFFEILTRQAADLLERTRSEQALRESEARFRTLAQAVPSFLFETDAEGCNIWTSNAWCRFTGQSAEDVHGHGWAQALHPDDRAANLEHWIECIQGGAPFESRQRLRRADGRYAWVMARALPVRDENGRIYRWVGSVTEIDDLIRTHEELRSYADELARFNRVAVDRELRMIELKRQVNDLCAELGRSACYHLPEADGQGAEVAP